jgi:hypothetical protein
MRSGRYIVGAIVAGSILAGRMAYGRHGIEAGIVAAIWAGCLAGLSCAVLAWAIGLSAKDDLRRWRADPSPALRAMVRGFGVAPFLGFLLYATLLDGDALRTTWFAASTALAVVSLFL